MNKQINLTITRSVAMVAKSMGRPLHLGFDPEYRLVYAGWGPAPAGMVPGEISYLTGNPAELLYEAITGHQFEEMPAMAEVEGALNARSEVFFDREINAVMALRVLAHYEDHLQPGLGQSQFDAQRRPVLAAPAAIPLPELAL